MALPAGSVRSPAKPRMRDLCQCGIGALNKNIIQMSEGRHWESAEAYSGPEQRCCIRANNICLYLFMIEKMYFKYECRRKGLIKGSLEDYRKQI